MIQDDQRRVKGIGYLQMELGEPDARGRRRPVPIKGSETIIELDMLISAISLISPSSKKHIPASLFKTIPGIEKKKRIPMPEPENAYSIHFY